MNLAKFENLPDSLNPEEIRRLFKELLSIQNAHDLEHSVRLAHAMDEIADRQWHTYALLDDRTRTEINNWVMSQWDPGSLQKTRSLISIIAKLGLVNAAKLLKRDVVLPIPVEVKNEIEDALREFGTNVDDPFFGMRKNEKLKRKQPKI
jgi:hypothetical protein